MRISKKPRFGSFTKKVVSANNVLRKHVKKFHPSKVDILAPLKKSTKKFDFSCKICNKNFSHKANLKYHIKNNHQDLSLSEIFRGTLKSSQKKYVRCVIKISKIENNC